MMIVLRKHKGVVPRIESDFEGWMRPTLWLFSFFKYVNVLTDRLRTNATMEKGLCHASIRVEASRVMSNVKSFLVLAISLACLMAGFSGCTIKATLDTTTDPTTEFLSSTTGGSWWTEDGLVKNGEHARAFVANNYDNLLQDMARGNGEYLYAFGTALNIPPRQQDFFQQFVQARYTVLAGIPVARGDVQINRFIDQVQHEWTRSTFSHLHPDLN
jgi:hypothetical protein